MRTSVKKKVLSQHSTSTWQIQFPELVQNHPKRKKKMLADQSRYIRKSCKLISLQGKCKFFEIVTTI